MLAILTLFGIDPRSFAQKPTDSECSPRIVRDSLMPSPLIVVRHLHHYLCRFLGCGRPKHEQVLACFLLAARTTYCNGVPWTRTPSLHRDARQCHEINLRSKKLRTPRSFLSRARRIVAARNFVDRREFRKSGALNRPLEMVTYVTESLFLLHSLANRRYCRRKCF